MPGRFHPCRRPFSRGSTIPRLTNFGPGRSSRCSRSERVATNWDAAGFGTSFIFGPRFLYSNCGQLAKPGLRALGPDSVVAFGSGKGIAGERRWMVDTVMVIAGSVEYGAGETREALSGLADEAFIEVTAGPIAANEEGAFRLYRGATPDDPVDGMFSFFPAMPAEGESGFPRPVLDLPAEYFNPRSWQAPKGLWRDRSSDELRGLWGSLVAHVRRARARARYPRDFAAEARDVDASGVKAGPREARRTALRGRPGHVRLWPDSSVGHVHEVTTPVSIGPAETAQMW